MQYVQLAHNEWLPQAKRANAKVLYNFGRREDVDIQSLERLISSIQKFIGAGKPKPAHKPLLKSSIRVKTLKDRRKTAAAVRDIVSALLKAEEQCVENTPANLQDSERYDMAQERVASLQTVLEALAEAYDD